MSTARLLTIENLHIRYGALEALKGVSLFLDQGEIVTVLGANGAGKSTLLRAVSCLLPASEGGIHYLGLPLQRVAPYDVVQRGISHAPEGRKVFSTLTVHENLTLGAFTRRRKKPEVAEARERVFGLFPVLKDRRQQLAGTLSGGEQQMLAIGRALMTRPRLLMLDEPSQGIMPKLVDEIFQAVKRIRDAGMTVLIVEQRMAECLEIADRAYILQTGRVLMQGTAAEITGNPDVRKAYLGL